MLEEQQQHSRDGLDDDLLVTVHVDSQLHALKDCDAGGHIRTRSGLQLFLNESRTRASKDRLPALRYQPRK